MANSSLHLACDREDLKLVEEILQKGGGHNLPNFDGDTPLHIACQRGNLAIVELLCSKPITNGMTRLNKNGASPLHMACENGHFAVVNLLLGQVKTDNDDLIFPNAEGETPVYLLNQSIFFLLIKTSI